VPTQFPPSPTHRSWLLAAAAGTLYALLLGVTAVAPFGLDFPDRLPIKIASGAIPFLGLAVWPVVFALAASHSRPVRIIGIGAMAVQILGGAIQASLYWRELSAFPARYLPPDTFSVPWFFAATYVFGQVALWRSFVAASRRGPAGACAACGYPTAGLSSPRCPECGAPHHPSSRSRPGRTAA